MKDSRVLPSFSWQEKLLPLRRQADIVRGWLRVRLDEVVPELMEREDLDMWILVSREYNEDPVVLTMLPPTLMNASWFRTILVFSRQSDGTIKRYTLARVPKATAYKVKSRSWLLQYFDNVWDYTAEDEWTCLGRLVSEEKPGSIGLNYSRTFQLADGISATEKEQVIEAIGPEYAPRIRSAERLAVGWLERRTKPELEAYTGIMQIAHGIIQEAFSSQVVHPGVTTSEDVVWWIRQRIHDLGLKAWFHPSVSIHRHEQQAPSPLGEDVILGGDVLHCDVGLEYLGLCTDTQQNAYVLKRGEQDAPQGIKDALADGNRLQDILTNHFVAGLTGNEVLEQAMKEAEAEGLRATIYTHPIGFHGHAAGTVVGALGVPIAGVGDYELFEDTCFSYELNVVRSVPEWGGQDLRIALEQDVLFQDEKVHYLAGRQRELHLIS